MGMKVGNASGSGEPEVMMELHLRPNKAARYEVVAQVMAGVQRFGLTKFGIVGAEQFIE